MKPYGDEFADEESFETALWAQLQAMHEHDRNRFDWDASVASDPAHDEFSLGFAGRSIDYASKIYLATGDVLYSNDSRPMFTIGEDRVGRHDFLLTPCSQEMFEILYRHQGHHPSCFENLHRLLAQFGIRPEQLGTTFYVFMNVRVDAAGTVSVEPPLSRAGDFVELRAEMDLVCALTSCSAEQSNNGRFKPIDFEILSPAH